MPDGPDAHAVEGATLPRIADLTIRPVGPDVHDDLMRYFDLVAYADNPAWSRCYCTERLQPDYEASTKDHNRALRSELILSGKAYGLVAYRVGRVVGWCHAAPKKGLYGLAGPATEDVGAIVCFVVAPDSRRMGIATALLGAAVDYLRGLGMRSAEGYPYLEEPRDPSSWPQVQYVGPLSIYRKHGFEVVATLGETAVVRKVL